MSTTKEALQQFEKTAVYYIHELDSFSLDQLKLKPSDHEWSIGQMIQHLINSALHMHLRNMDQCLEPTRSPGISSGQNREGCSSICSRKFPAYTYSGAAFPPIHATTAGKQGEADSRAAYSHSENERG
ncbi:DinB family protein [Paenibacillus chibensis]|uniref:DinB family protein n=1 Tax=Paenibacillus chibensis TaxID=59846 RepID=UPI003FCD11F0